MDKQHSVVLGITERANDRRRYIGVGGDRAPSPAQWACEVAAQCGYIAQGALRGDMALFSQALLHLGGIVIVALERYTFPEEDRSVKGE